eukprot:TRINITY_DN10929_c0_g1_i1.p1 TRINITY_DN10929_c0_g1~~TRINITY_DN10929_c0_g1_i1.p1  ORF type:complete len:551 (-),score=136.16 TRINITY_DN10929_c0_g1_i1:755-2407(-)
MKRANLEEPSNSSSTKRPAKDTQASLEEHQPAATTSGEGSGSQAPLFDAEAHIRRRQEGLEERMRRGLQAAMRSNLHMDLRNRLTAKEQQVFELLLESAKSQEHGSTGNTVIRVAGGWVRDKLLGLQNHDIDVALDDVSGLAFAQVVNAQLKAKGEQTRTIGVIQANPQQSKHLETATVKVLDMPIDFVNLRTESYAQDSRIPEMEFGSAEEDAYRRDFTINALFYNVNTESVEDLTGDGLNDLAQGIIRTPLPPDVTFYDDPLRVLRAVRFASRFGFDLAPAIASAAASDTIHTALIEKVRRERIGSELEGMLTGRNARPAVALSLLHQLRLLPAVFGTSCLQGFMPMPPFPDEGLDWDSAACAVRWVSWLIARKPDQSQAAKPAADQSDAVQHAASSQPESVQPEGAEREASIAGTPVIGAAAIAKASKQTLSTVQPERPIAFLSAALLPVMHMDAIPAELVELTGLEPRPHLTRRQAAKGMSMAQYVVKDGLKLKAKYAQVHKDCQVTSGSDTWHHFTHFALMSLHVVCVCTLVGSFHSVLKPQTMA